MASAGTNGATHVAGELFKALIGMGSIGYSEMRGEQQKGFVPPSYRQISTIRPF